MTAPMVPLRAGDDPLDALKALKQQRAPDPLDELKAMRSGATSHDIHSEYASGRLASRMARENTNDAEQAAVDSEPTYGQKALGGIASLARDIPGAEAVQAGLRSIVRRQPYREARNDIRSAEDAAGPVSTANRLIGGTVAGAAIPGRIAGKIISPAMQGAAYGAASGALQSNPDAGLWDRTKDAGLDAAIGGVTGKLADAGTNLVRSAATTPLGAQALERKTAMQAADAANYGQAAREAAANGGTSGLIRATLGSSDIKPFADIVRQSRSFAGADDATVLREAYKLMSERQGLLKNRMINADDFKAGTTLENKDLGAAKADLLAAADKTMPTFRTAVEQHAQSAGEDAAMRTGSRATRTLLSGKQAAEKNLLGRSPESFESSITGMTPEQADAALSGVLGRAKDYTSLSANPLKGFGVPRSIGVGAKVSPLVHQLDTQAGGAPTWVDIMRALAASEGHPAP